MITPTVIPGLLMLVPVIEQPSDQEQPPEGVSVYRTNWNDQAIAFSTRARGLKLVYGPYRRSIWQTDWGGLFKIRNVNGVLYERFTALSVPVDIEKVTNWEVDGWHCRSTKFFTDRWLIQCSGKVDYSYIYRKNVGILGFDFSCGAFLRCWYELETEKGIFPEL